MTTKDFKNFTNPNPLYNVPQFIAVALGYRCALWTRYNLKFKFLPPHIHSVSLWPSTEAEFPEDYDSPISQDLFQVGGLLHDTPLNHYITLVPRWGQQPLHINAGHIGQYFLFSEAAGYHQLSKILKSHKAGRLPQMEGV